MRDYRVRAFVTRSKFCPADPSSNCVQRHGLWRWLRFPNRATVAPPQEAQLEECPDRKEWRPPEMNFSLDQEWSGDRCFPRGRHRPSRWDLSSDSIGPL